MIGILAPLYYLFGKVLELIVTVVPNYAIAILLFTLLTRLVLLPGSVSQQKTMAKNSRLQPKIAKIQKRYANDKGKMNQEIQNLYSREKHNPMSMGCLPMLFQMIILFGVIGAIYYPLQYVVGIDKATITTLTDSLKEIVKTKITYPELEILHNLPALQDAAPKGVGVDVFDQIRAFGENFKLFGIDLTQKPEFKKLNIYWLIPAFSGVTSMLSSVYSYFIQKKNNPGAAGNSSMMMMSFIMPIFSLWIAFTVPCGVGYYWTCANVISMFQMMILNQTHSPKKVTARLMVEETIQRRSREENVKRITGMK